MPSYDRALHALRTWLDSWSGIGLIVVGMTHQGWDVQLTAYAARDWRANFFPVGIAHLHRRRLGVGADAVEGGAEGGVARGGSRPRVARTAGSGAYGQGHSGVGGHAAATGVGPIATYVATAATNVSIQMTARVMGFSLLVAWFGSDGRGRTPRDAAGPPGEPQRR
jgi:hypothetical protein